MEKVQVESKRFEFPRMYQTLANPSTATLLLLAVYKLQNLLTRNLIQKLCLSMCEGWDETGSIPVQYFVVSLAEEDRSMRNSPFGVQLN